MSTGSRSQDSPVGIVTRLNAGQHRMPTSIFGRKIFSRLQFVQALWSSQSPIQREPAALQLVLKRKGRETNHSPCATEVKNCWTLTNTPNAPLLCGQSINKIYFVEQ
jgi:hypothetical protein